MDIFAVLTGISGLALFLYGMKVMGDGLSVLSGGKMEIILEKLTSTRIKAVLLGALVTAVIQSSSATTVMVVGFVNSGIMQLGQAVGIIMGANIGTTITSWILSLAGVSSKNIFIKLLKPSSFAPILALIGIILLMSNSKKEKNREIGSILMGFAILMFGMENMSGAVAPLASNEKFTNILLLFSNPILGMLAGALLTAVIQSSSASVGILQALCLTGAVGYKTAIPIIMGQNIGTCVTAIISSFGASKNAKRASMIHLYFNLIGTVVFMTAFYGINAFVHFEFMEKPATAVGIAIIHSLFNIGCAILLFPFANVLVKLATKTVKDEKDNTAIEDKTPEEIVVLDERFLSKPAFAIELCRQASIKMATETQDCILAAMNSIKTYNEEQVEYVKAKEQQLDLFEDRIGTYLHKISGKNLTMADSRNFSILFHCISDMERISDHAANIAESVAELNAKKQEFSEDALRDLDVLISAVSDIINMTTDVFVNYDIEKAKNVEPLEEIIDGLNVTIRQNHISRLRKGLCTVELGIILEDIITDLERISDHCSNIAVCLLQVSKDDFDTHEYIDFKLKQTPWFAEEVERLQEKYYVSKS